MHRSLLLAAAALCTSCIETGINSKPPNLGANDSGPVTNATGTGTGTPTTGVWTWGSGTGGTTTGGPGTGGAGSGTGGGAGTGGVASGTGGVATGGPGTGGVGTGTGAVGTGTGGTASWDECDWAAAVAGYLDPLQTAGDGRVLFCHSSAGSNYVYVDASISSCLTHIGHNYDIFPTQLCGD